jgi:hypothetical protein
VLSRAEYQEADPGLVRRILSFLGEWLGRALENIVGAGEQNVVGTTVIVVVTLVTVFLVLWFVRGVRRDPGQDVALSGTPGRPPREWLAEAEEHERAGRWREALRCRYRLLLARLAAQGLVDEVPGRTSGEYLAEATQSVPAAAADLRGVTLAFERVWYGNHPVGGAEVGQVAEAVERVDAVARGARIPVQAGASGAA